MPHPSSTVPMAGSQFACPPPPVCEDDIDVLMEVVAPPPDERPPRTVAEARLRVAVVLQDRAAQRRRIRARGGSSDCDDAIAIFFHVVRFPVCRDRERDAGREARDREDATAEDDEVV